MGNKELSVTTGVIDITPSAIVKSVTEEAITGTAIVTEVQVLQNIEMKLDIIIVILLFTFIYQRVKKTFTGVKRV